MPWRGLVVALVIIALLVASLALLAGSGKKQLPGTVRPRRDRAWWHSENGGDIVATLPDGTNRRTLIADEGFQWGKVWSRRGDRFAQLVGHPPPPRSRGIPASLWVADRDGSNRHVVTTNLGVVPDVADLVPAVQLVARRPPPCLRGRGRPLSSSTRTARVWTRSALPDHQRLVPSGHPTAR